MERATVAGVEVDTRHWIGGRRVASAMTFADVSPIDGAIIAEIARGGAEEVDAAVDAASEAFRAWSRTPPEERAAILHRIADGVEKRIEELAQVETRDNGSLLRSHRRGVMPRVALNFRFFADHLLRAATRRLGDPRPPQPRHLGSRRRHRDRHPLERAPHARDLAHRPGARRGQHRRRQAAGVGAADGVPARRHRRARRACPTACSTSSRAWAPRPARRSWRTPGCGGSASPAAVPTARQDRRGGGRERHAGQLRARRQVAAAGARRRRPRPRRRPRRRAVRQLGAGLPGRRPDPGAGADRRRVPRGLPGQSPAPGATARATPATRRRPSGRWSGATHLERVDGFVRRAVADGARVLLGGEPNAELNERTGGFYYRPTVFEGVDPTSEIVCREVFGPVLTLQTLRRARTRGSRWRTTPSTASRRRSSPGSQERAERVSARLDAGTVWVNCFFVRDLAAPVRRQRAQRDRPRGRHLELRLLLRRQEQRLRTEGMAKRPMGEVVGAGLLAHVPTIMLPEQARRELNNGEEISLVPGLRAAAPRGLRDARLRHGRRARLATGSRRSSSCVTAQDRRAGLFTSEELPRGMCRIPYDWPGRPRAGARDGRRCAEATSTWVTAIDDPYLPVYYATVNLWHYLGRGLPDKRWISVSVCQTGDTEDFLRAGRALGDAIAATDRRVVLLASRRAVAHVLAAAGAARRTRQRPVAHPHPGGPRRRPRADRVVRGRGPRAGARRRCPSSCATGPRRSSATT